MSYLDFVNAVGDEPLEALIKEKNVQADIKEEIDQDVDLFNMDQAVQTELESIKSFEELEKQEKLRAKEVADELDKLEYERWVKDNRPNKGVIKKEIWDTPVPSHRSILANNKVDYKLQCAILLNSNFGGKFDMMNNNKDNHRYIYKNKLWHLSENEQKRVDQLKADGKKDVKGVPEIAQNCGMSLSTFKRNLKILTDPKNGILEVETNGSDIYYKIKYSVDGRYFVTIKSDMLNELVTSCSSDVIKIYTLLSYHLTDPIIGADGEYLGSKYITKQMTYNFIAKELGKDINETRMRTMLKSLAKLGFIKISDPIMRTKVNINKETGASYSIDVKTYDYTLCTHEEWLAKDQDVVKTK